MADSDTASSSPSINPHKPTPKVSLGRVLAVVVPVIIVAMVGSFLLGAYWKTAAREELEQEMLSRLLASDLEPVSAGESQYIDADGDLLADPPADEDCLVPERIVFSFIASEVDRERATVWKEVMDALSERLGKPVEYVHFSKTDQQLEALRDGQLHVTVLNTGTVPTAVRTAGFIPLCTFGNADGTFGYTMQIIVPADSDIKQPNQLRGRKITFTRPNSNSGFKAALVMLMSDFGLRPERDYEWGFSLGHEESIAGVVTRKFQAAPVASDVLDRVAARGEVDPAALRSVYESKRFPPATVGLVYNLSPELREGIRETLLGFDWEGSGLVEEYGEGGKFVPVSYKDDWEGTREIDEAFAEARAQLVKLPARSAMRSPPPTAEPTDLEDLPTEPASMDPIDEATDEDLTMEEVAAEE